MSPAAASTTTRRAAAQRAAAQREAARRRTVTRRRRTALWAVAVIGLITIVIVAMPDVKKVYNSLSLPLADQDIIRVQASQEHLDPALVAAVIDTETKFDARTSPAGAEGLMQIEPATAEFLAHRSGGYAFKVSDLATPQVNIAYGSYYLRYLLDEYGENKIEALAAYNGGETNVDRWIAAAREAGHPFGIGDITFPETAAYVTKVLTAEKAYRRTYPSELGYR